MSHWHQYSGKPSGTLTVPKSAGYVRLDIDVPDPAHSGCEFHMLYLNSQIEWEPGPGPKSGVIRVKYIRENGDDTAYGDHTVTEQAIGNPDTFLITQVHFEPGQAGQGGRWWVECAGQIKALHCGTRYCKISVIY
jgi:hypothetical protein